MALPVPKRRYSWGETAFLMAYLQATYPGRLTRTNMRVGSLAEQAPRPGLTPSQLKLMGAFNRYPDAVVETPGGLVVIEAKIRKVMEAIGDLLVYAERIPETEELGALRFGPLRLELVAPFPDADVRAICLRTGIVYVVFPWPDLDRFLSERQQYFRRRPAAETQQVF